MVNTAAFLRQPESMRQATFLTDLSSIDTNKVGRHKVEIQIHKRVYTSVLNIVDTTPPAATPRPQAVFRGARLSPEDFVEDIRDIGQVSVAFARTPDFDSVGIQTVSLLLQDQAGNQTSLQSELTVLDIQRGFYIEAGSNTALTADILDEASRAIAASAGIHFDTRGLPVHQVGTQQVPFTLGSCKGTLPVVIKDTVPPKATPVNHTIYAGKVLKPEDFVTNIRDATKVEVAFKNQPDFMKVGTSYVPLELTDQGGNKTTLLAKLTVLKDTVPPVIKGPTVKYVIKGEAVAYKRDLNIYDNSGAEVDVQVDSSKVNLNKPGRYPVRFTATDPSGNVSYFSITVVVKEDVPYEKVEPLARKVLDSIIKPGDDDVAKCKAIYRWIQANVRYVSTGEKLSVNAGAYTALTIGSGDCYTFYAIGEYLLTLAGVENIGVKRVPTGQYSHYWSLVKIGDLWYHFDSCPNTRRLNTCLFGQQRAAEFSQLLRNQYYEYDKRLIPELPIAP